MPTTPLSSKNKNVPRINGDATAQPEQTNRPQVAEFREKIIAAWNKQVASIIEVGKLLIEAKDSLDHGEWEGMFANGGLPFSANTAVQLMKIAADPIISNPAYMQLLPPHWGTLYELTKLTKLINHDTAEFEAIMKDRGINAETERVEVIRTVAQLARSKVYDFAHLADALKVLEGYSEKWPEGNLPDKAFEDLGDEEHENKEDNLNVLGFVERLQPMADWLKKVQAACRTYVERDREAHRRNEEEDEAERKRQGKYQTPLYQGRLPKVKKRRRNDHYLKASKARGR